jgi:hypothetical protein
VRLEPTEPVRETAQVSHGIGLPADFRAQAELAPLFPMAINVIRHERRE